MKWFVGVGGDVGFSLLWPHGLFSSIIGQCWANRALEKLASVKHRQKHVTSRQQQTQSSQWQSDTLCQCPGYLQHVRTKHTALTLFTFVYLLFDFAKKRKVLCFCVSDCLQIFGKVIFILSVSCAVFASSFAFYHIFNISEIIGLHKIYFVVKNDKELHL